MADLPEKALFRIDEAAEYLSVHSKTVRRWIDEGFLLAEKLGGSIRIPRESIVKFRDKGRELLKKV